MEPTDVFSTVFIMQTPEPDNGPITKDRTLSEMEDHLDELWESYLALLDHYTKAQDEIKKHMNSGFLSLAKAQSSASLGRRYGQDWYDERMKASRRTQVENSLFHLDEDLMTSGLQSLSVSMVLTGPDGQVAQNARKLNPEGDKDEPEQRPLSSPSTPEPEVQFDQAEDGQSDKTAKSALINPLRWFGVLVPPELKKAQVAFCAVLADPTASKELENTARDCIRSPIANATNAARGLRDIEVEIRKTRKAMRKAEKIPVVAAC